MAPHTPGPWKVQPVIGTYIYTAGDPYGHGQMHIADVRGWGHLTGRGGGCAFDEQKAIGIQTANARLIAAAPELLKLLTAASHALRSYQHGNAATDLAKGCADAIDALIAETGR